MAQRTMYKIVVENRIIDNQAQPVEPIPAVTPTADEPTVTTTPKQGTTTPATQKVKSKSNIANMVGVQVGKMALQYAAGNYGNLTGDYAGQEKLNAGIEIAGYVGMIAAAGGLGIAIVGAQLASKAVSYAIELQKDKIRVEFLRKRVGYHDDGRGR